MIKILAGFYTNNKVRESLLVQSLRFFEIAASQANVIPVISSWQDTSQRNCRNLISHFQFSQNGHLNILLQLYQIVHSTQEAWDYFAFCEHDCLYPENYFSELCELLSNAAYPGVASANHIGLRPNGYAGCWNPTHPLFAMVVRRDVLLKSLDEKLRECVLNGWCCIEPDDRNGWLIRNPDNEFPPIIHVNMNTTSSNHHLTNHYDFYSMTKIYDEHSYWGHHAQFGIFTDREVHDSSRPLINSTTSRIVDAWYGDFASNRVVSYFHVLRERQFSGLFQVSNRDAGMDPAPGVRKVLRLEVITNDSSPIQFEFSENAVFRL